MLATLAGTSPGEAYTRPSVARCTAYPAADTATVASTAPAAAAPAITDRRGLTACLIGVETYYAMHEPASPVPLLLIKARDMLTKRFDAIVAELIAAPARQGE